MAGSLIAVAETLEFLDRALPSGGRLLEIGCGAGEVAAELLARGFEVTALDRAPEAVERARARGVDARQVTYPDFRDEPFDVVLFVRCLHHVASLEETLDRSAALLRPGGLLAVEDFAWEDVDARTAAWGYGLLGAFAAAGLVPAEEWEPGDDARETWHREHRDEGLHTGARMLREVGERFVLERREPAPYFYRFFCRHLEQRSFGAEVASRVLRAERELIAEGGIAPLGLRFAARRVE